MTPKTLTLKSNAKVNLALDILGRNESDKFKGYHFIQTVLHEITPENTHGFEPDILTITIEDAAKNTQSNITLTCSDPTLPTDETNIAYKAAELMIKQQSQPANITIHIQKNIPIASGLGGGSSNAATVMKGLNHLLTLDLPASKLKLLASEIGMDVPFFIEGGVALAEHFGEQITQLPPVHGLAFVLDTTKPGANSDHDQKTAQKYAQINLSPCGKDTGKTEQLVHAIKTNDSLAIHPLLHNDFETLPGYSEPHGQKLQGNYHLTGAGPARFLLV